MSLACSVNCLSADPMRAYSSTIVRMLGPSLEMLARCLESEEPRPQRGQVVGIREHLQVGVPQQLIDLRVALVELEAQQRRALARREEGRQLQASCWRPFRS